MPFKNAARICTSRGSGDSFARSNSACMSFSIMLFRSNPCLLARPRLSPNLHVFDADLCGTERRERGIRRFPGRDWPSVTEEDVFSVTGVPQRVTPAAGTKGGVAALGGTGEAMRYLHLRAVGSRAGRGVTVAKRPTEPGWRNWQTQRTQNPPRATSWGFDPPSRHHTMFSATSSLQMIFEGEG
jgi:hypothetical protein